MKDLGEKFEVEWIDAYENSAGWHSIEDAINLKPKTVLSLGYLLWEDKDKINIASDIDPKIIDILKKHKSLDQLLKTLKKLELDGSDCGRVQTIPKGWIKKKILMC
jgi:hypothetical protein